MTTRECLHHQRHHKRSRRSQWCSSRLKPCRCHLSLVLLGDCAFRSIDTASIQASHLKLPKDPLRNLYLPRIGRTNDTRRDNILYYICARLEIYDVLPNGDSDLSCWNCNKRLRLFCVPFVLHSIVNIRIRKRIEDKRREPHDFEISSYWKAPMATLHSHAKFSVSNVDPCETNFDLLALTAGRIVLVPWP